MTQKIKVSDFEISNSKKLTVIAGLNVLENDELTFKVADELKAIVESKGNPLFLKHLLIRQIDRLLIHIEDLDLMKA